MPYDSNGVDLKKGDRVVLELEVLDVKPGVRGVNTTLKVVDPRGGFHEYLPVVSCDGRLTTKMAAEPAPAAPPQA